MLGSLSGVCRGCGETGIGLPFGEWVRTTFTDWDKLVPGEIICHACQFAFGEASSELAQRVGKDKPQRMRNYSHFVVAGEWSPLSKADKPRMTALLLAEPEVAIVAISGQKHIIFRAQPGWWQIEEQSVFPFPVELAGLLPLVGELYAGGLSKAEIATGRYSTVRLMRFEPGIARWREIEARIRPLRGALRLELALFLVQKEKDDSDGQIRDRPGPVDPNLAGYSDRLQEPVSAQNLAAVRGQYPFSSLHRQPESFRQQSLFEIAGESADS